MSEEITVRRLGRRPYGEVLALQRDLQNRRKAGACPDTLLLVEHEPVITLGRNADRRNILATPTDLDALGIEVVSVERGGDVTYHGPGQLVGYPILDLSGYQRDVRRYIRLLENTAVRLLATYGVSAAGRSETPGVWAAGGKIASVGVFISRWVSMHGIAINIVPDLSHFDLIRACGLPDVRMTSLACEHDGAVRFDDAEARYSEVFTAALQAWREEASSVPYQERARSSAR